MNISNLAVGFDKKFTENIKRNLIVKEMYNRNINEIVIKMVGNRFFIHSSNVNEYFYTFIKYKKKKNIKKRKLDANIDIEKITKKMKTTLNM